MSIRPDAMQETADRFRTYLSKVRGRQPRTVQAYMEVVTAFAEYLPRTETGEGMPFAHVEKAQLLAFLTGEARGESESSASRWNLRLAALRALFDWLFKNEVIAVNPAQRIDRQVVHSTQPVPPDLDEMLCLIDVLRDRSPAKLATRNVALAQVLMHCGLRVQELVSLKLSQVDLAGRYLVDVRTKGGKWLSAPLNDVVVEALQAYLRDRRQLVFPEEPEVLFVTRAGAPLTVRVVQLLIKEYAKRAGISRRITPHLLRHSSATKLVELGVNIRVVQEHLNHSNIRTTQRYTRVSDPQRRDAVDRFGAAWRERERQRGTGT